MPGPGRHEFSRGIRLAVKRIVSAIVYTLPVIARPAQPVVAIGFCPEGVEFDAGDGQKTRLIAMVLTPAKGHETQLELLAQIAGVFKDQRTIDRALDCKTHTHLLALVNTRDVPGERTEKGEARAA